MDIYAAIKEERMRQDEKWGEQNHHPLKWIVILAEEVGEAAERALDYDPGNQYVRCAYLQELIQCAAVCVAAIESAERQKKAKERS